MIPAMPKLARYLGSSAMCPQQLIAAPNAVIRR